MSLIACCNGQQVLRNTCGAPANAKANAARPVGLPQTSKQMPGDLRDSRKRQSKCRETCGSTRKRQSKCRETCGSTRKRQSKCYETCGTPRKRPKVLRGTCNSVVGISKKFWSGFRRNSLRALFLHRTHVVQRFLRPTCPVKTTTPGED